VLFSKKERETTEHLAAELEKEIKRTGHTWKQLERIAQDRGDWRVVIGGLCSRRSEGPK